MAAVAEPKKKKNLISLRQKQGIWGMIFLAPWFLGFLLFFARPFIDTVRYAFSDVSVDIVDGGMSMEWVGLDNFIHALTVDVHFNRYIFALPTTLVMVIIVVIFSLLAAILINGKYFGRGIVRTVFFIPIIMAANLAVAQIAGNDMITEATSAGDGFGGFSTMFWFILLYEAGIPANLVVTVMDAISRIFEVLAQSGVPILIFLAGLQAIPPSLYEVAHIEGSTKYETFWKVTLPMISPMILISTVYTVTDLFARHAITGVGIPRVALAGGPAPFLEYIRFIGMTGGGVHSMNYGLASAMAFMFVMVTLIVIVLVTWLISKGVFYYD